MYAIIENGGKQYKVSPGETIRVEKMPDASGSQVVIEKVLLVKKDDTSMIGSPYVSGAKVLASVEHEGKLRKAIVFKQRPRKVFRKRRGHRQPYTALKINDIQVGG